MGDSQVKLSEVRGRGARRHPPLSEVHPIRGPRRGGVPLVRGPSEVPAQRTEPLASKDFGKEMRVLILWAKNKQSSFQYREKDKSFS